MPFRFGLSLYLSIAVAALSCGRTDLEFSGLSDAGVGFGGRDGGADASGGRGVAGGPGSGGGVPATGGRPGSGGRAATGGAGGRTGTGGRPATGGATGVPDGGLRDGGTDGVTVDGPGQDLPPSMPGRLSCGSQTCDTSTQSCCISLAAGALTSRCVPAGATCAGATLACDEPADCATGVCCFGLQPGAGLSVGSACTTRAACGGIGRFVVCRANSDCGPAMPLCCPAFGARICRVSCAGN